MYMYMYVVYTSKNKTTLKKIKYYIINQEINLYNL